MAIFLIALAGLILFYFAYQSRRTYRCPECGEKITTEYLDAQRCSTCGTPLEGGTKP